MTKPAVKDAQLRAIEHLLDYIIDQSRGLAVPELGALLGAAALVVADRLAGTPPEAATPAIASKLRLVGAGDDGTLKRKA